jgi:hypothetical protein
MQRVQEDFARWEAAAQVEFRRLRDKYGSKSAIECFCIVGSPACWVKGPNGEQLR